MSVPPGKIYFTQYEKELILALAKPHINVIENKETNGVTLAEKAVAFREIAKRFNDAEGVNHRYEKQIRQCYQNLKKRLRQKSTRLRQEQRKTGGGDIPKDVELSSLDLQFLKEPMLTQPLSTVWDSDTTRMEIMESQDESTSVNSTPKHSAPAELATSSMNYLEVSFEEAEETPEAVSAEPAGDEKTPKARTLRETLMMFRKKENKKQAPSAAARAAACIKAEHSQTIKNMEKEEERKHFQAEAAKKEHELRMQLLQEQIKLTKTKTQLNEKLLELIDTNPKYINQLFNNVLNE